jgi:allophanate hydrolase subunit 1
MARGTRNRIETITSIESIGGGGRQGAIRGYPTPGGQMKIKGKSSTCKQDLRRNTVATFRAGRESRAAPSAGRKFGD